MLSDQQLNECAQKLNILFFNEIYTIPSLAERILALRAMRACISACYLANYPEEIMWATPDARQKMIVPNLNKNVEKFQSQLSELAWRVVENFKDAVCIKCLIGFEDILTLMKEDKTQAQSTPIAIDDIYQLTRLMTTQLLEMHQNCQTKDLYLDGETMILPTVCLFIHRQHAATIPEDDLRITIMLDGDYDLETHPAKGLEANFRRIAEQCQQNKTSFQLLDEENEPRFDLQLCRLSEKDTLTRKSSQRLSQAHWIWLYSTGKELQVHLAMIEEYFANNVNEVVNITCHVLKSGNNQKLKQTNRHFLLAGSAKQTSIANEMNQIRLLNRSEDDDSIIEQFDDAVIRLFEQCWQAMPKVNENNNKLTSTSSCH